MLRQSRLCLEKLDHPLAAPEVICIAVQLTIAPLAEPLFLFTYTENDEVFGESFIPTFVRPPLNAEVAVTIGATVNLPAGKVIVVELL
jgi:hypothetical protein